MIVKLVCKHCCTQALSVVLHQPAALVNETTTEKFNLLGDPWCSAYTRPDETVPHEFELTVEMP